MESDDKKKGNGGTTTKHTRHGLVTIKPNPTTSPTTESVKSTTTATTTATPSKRKNSQQCLADVDVTKDATENLSAKVPPTSAGVEGTVLGFTSYRKPPGYVPSSSVYGLLELMGLTGDWLVLISEIMFGERAAVMKTRRLEWRRNGRERSKSNEKANIVSSTKVQLVNSV